MNNPNTISNRFTRFLPPLVLLLILWFTRLNALELLPLHNDEGLHLTRAGEVWSGHPFWVISDGKIINHWLIAIFYPQHAPVFTGRIATVFVAMLGLAAGYALARRLGGTAGGVLAAVLWITCPYLFFYERIAFSDPEAGALVVVSLWSLVASRQSSVASPEKNRGVGKYISVVWAGLFLALAMLFKFTAAPYALSVALVVLFAGAGTRRERLMRLAIIGAVVAACFAIPLGYLLIKGEDLFAIAFGWIGGSSSGGQPAFLANVGRLWAQLTGFGTFAWVPLTALGIAFSLQPLVASRQSPVASRMQKMQLPLLGVAAVVPLLLMMLLGREVLSRHFVVVLPLILTTAGAGLGRGLQGIRDVKARQLMTAFGAAGLAFGVVPFMLTAWTNPAALHLPEDARYEHITSHSSGYGLREALEAFPQTIARRELPIIGSMFPDSCRRANFYAVDKVTMRCVAAPGVPEIEEALKDFGAVYVLVDDAPNIGVDVTTLIAQATKIGFYPRPGESDEDASVVLWLLTDPSSETASLMNCTVDAAQTAREGTGVYNPSAVSDFVTLRDGQFMIGDSLFAVRGVNYYPSRYPWRRFLTESTMDSINQELAMMRAAGLNTLRLFLWNDALFTCPQYGAVPIAVNFKRLDNIIQAAAEAGFRLIVTLNDMPDLTRTPLYDNPQHVIAQTHFIVERYKDEAAILAWDLRNEGDIDYGSNHAATIIFPRQVVLDWLANTSAMVRGLDSNHLITAGWLYDAEATAPYVDFVSFHHWSDAESLRGRIATMRAATDKPLLLEEFGYSTFRVSPEVQSELINGVSGAVEESGLLGWLVWTAFDFPRYATCIAPACPSADNAEHHFGLWGTDYVAKPALDALKNRLMP